MILVTVISLYHNTNRHKIENLFISADNVVRPCLTRKKHKNMSIVTGKMSVLLFLLI